MVSFVGWLKRTMFWLPENPSGNEWSGAAGVCVLICFEILRGQYITDIPEISKITQILQTISFLGT